jgi:D-alanyl-lipoteichoic acid acyltransferase DltB (MBOAT superfamily)
MLFGAQPFVLVFLPAVLAAVQVARLVGGRAPLAVVLGASLTFYGAWRVAFLPLLIGSIAMNYSAGWWIGWLRNAGIETGAHVRKRAVTAVLACGIALNLLLLFWFKYAGFAARVVGLGPPGVALPLAISFFTFQQIMFLADRARGRCPAVGLLDYATFVAFFPHLIAGPLVRPGEIIPQLAARDLGRWDGARVASGLTVFLLGLAKKLVLADTFATYADAGFGAAAQGADLTLAEAWCAVPAYTLQIYFDFSGYSDMAIGLARMLGVRFPLNFAAPYRAASIADFWRRWHITLGLFLRDYVYIPMGGNRCGAWRQRANLMATMLLGGLWHGAAWTFVLWGGLHGAFLVVHAGWRRLGVALPRAVGVALTLLAVTLAWVPFRADGMAAAWAMFRGLAGANGLALPQMIVAAAPWLGRVATPVAVLPYLGDARTLALPEAVLCLMLGWTIVLALPHVHALSERARGWSVGAGFALTVQALFFAPNVSPFLYFRF